MAFVFARLLKCLFAVCVFFFYFSANERGGSQSCRKGNAAAAFPGFYEAGADGRTER